LATARALAGDGAEVVVTGRDPAKLAAVDPTVATAEHVDGTSESDVAAFFARVGGFEHLVLAFSPGVIGRGPLRETPIADIRAAFDGKVARLSVCDPGSVRTAHRPRAVRQPCAGAPSLQRSGAPAAPASQAAPCWYRRSTSGPASPGMSRLTS
jgi:NAD(P)-dependent dehydrogenase (short-subunit alcohol dehydrogenase family)